MSKKDVVNSPSVDEPSPKENQEVTPAPSAEEVFETWQKKQRQKKEVSWFQRFLRVFVS